MMVRLLLYGYAKGVYSSRKIQTRTFEDLGFRYLSGDHHPDHATIAEFRKRHLEALSGLFTQALLLCSEAGLVKLGHVSIDGTRIKANASKHKAVETSSDLPPPGASPKEAMREKLRTEAGRTEAGRAVYKMRKAIVEPVFGQINEQHGFRRFS